MDNKNIPTDGLDKEKIDNLFEEINEALKEKNQQGSILMAGGAVLATVYQARHSTRDIDAQFRPSEEMREIISSLSDKHDLPEDWLNDGVKGFMTKAMQTATSLYKEYSHLTVDTLNAEPMLAMKLSSARQGSQDLSDSLVLMKALDIKTLNQCFNILEKYINPQRLTPNTSIFTEIAFERHQKPMEKSHIPEATKEKSKGLEL